MIGSLIGGALGIGASIYGGLKASEAMKKVEGDLQGQQRENQAWYDRRYNEDATQRADAQRMLNITMENLKERNRAAAGRAAVTGGTEESLAATKAAGAQAMADATSRIVSDAEARKDGIEQQYRQRKAGLEGQLNNMEVARANAIAQAAGGVAGAAGTAGASIDDGLTEKAKLAAKLGGRGVRTGRQDNKTTGL